MSVERCYVILYPISGRKKFSMNVAFVVIAFIWLYAFSLSIPPLFSRVNRYVMDPSSTTCTREYLPLKSISCRFIVGDRRADQLGLPKPWMRPIWAVEYAHRQTSAQIKLWAAPNTNPYWLNVPFKFEFYLPRTPLTVGSWLSNSPKGIQAVHLCFLCIGMVTACCNNDHIVHADYHRR